MRHARLLLIPALLWAAACSDSISNPASPTGSWSAANETAPVTTASLKATAPSPAAPPSGTLLDSRQPTLRANGATPTVAGTDTSTLRHRFQVLSDDGRVVAEAAVEGTTWTVPQALDFARTYRWQVRAESGTVATVWSAAASFRTPDEPPTILGRGPYPTDGPSIVRWVAARWPEMLVGNVSEERRFKNVEFLRDRIIEAGRCGGMDLAWNLKRGVGPHSHDALAWRDGGRVWVVDFALASKDPRFPMALQWVTVGGEPGYDRYTNVFRCVN